MSEEIKQALDSFAQLCYQRSKDAGWWAFPTKLFKQLKIYHDGDFQSPNWDGIDHLIEGLVEALETATIGMKIALIHSEISEALEGFRKGLMDDHLTNRKMIDVELGDALIRIGDLAGRLRDKHNAGQVGAATVEKLEYNVHRADHKIEVREGMGGKKF